MAGRKCKLTDDVQKRLTDAIRLGATYKLACAYAGIHISTMLNWMRAGEQAASGRFLAFFEAIKEAEGLAAVGWLAKIEAAATDGVWQAAAWKLERRYPEIYGPQVRHRIGGDPDAPPIEVESNVSDADLIREVSGILDAARARAAYYDPSLDAVRMAIEGETESTRADR